ncbi:MAG: hypothetical protein P4N24_22580 [Acidobacteriota bacterium]|nr:hypothetical protein [Acidobacteriota bacterium]
MRPRRRFTMPVEYSDPQQVHLQKHQEIGSESAPGFPELPS